MKKFFYFWGILINKLIKIIMKNILTNKEIKVLEEIKLDQNEPGHSDFLSYDAKTKSVAGVVSSLEKKGMIYNSYDNWTRQDFADQGDKPFKMWCFTELASKIVGTPDGWK